MFLVLEAANVINPLFTYVYTIRIYIYMLPPPRQGPTLLLPVQCIICPGRKDVSTKTSTELGLDDPPMILVLFDVQFDRPKLGPDYSTLLLIVFGCQVLLGLKHNSQYVNSNLACTTN